MTSQGDYKNKNNKNLLQTYPVQSWKPKKKNLFCGQITCNVIKKKKRKHTNKLLTVKLLCDKRTFSTSVCLPVLTECCLFHGQRQHIHVGEKIGLFYLCSDSIPHQNLIQNSSVKALVLMVTARKATLICTSHFVSVWSDRESTRFFGGRRGGEIGLKKCK